MARPKGEKTGSRGLRERAPPGRRGNGSCPKSSICLIPRSAVRRGSGARQTPLAARGQAAAATCSPATAIRKHGATRARSSGPWERSRGGVHCAGATIHGNHRASHVSSAWRGEESDHVGDLLRGGRTPRWCVAAAQPRAACRSADLGDVDASAHSGRRPHPTRLTYSPPPSREPSTRRTYAQDGAGCGSANELRRTTGPSGARIDAAGRFHRKAVLAAGFPLRRDGDRPASNRKCVTRSVPHSTDANEKPAICRLFNSGGGTRTRDLRV